MTQLSHDGGVDGLFTNYHEFAYYMPGANRIMYGSTVGSPKAVWTTGRWLPTAARPSA